MSWIDIVLVLAIAFSAFAGWQRGFLMSSLDLARWIGSWFAGLLFYRPVAQWLEQVTDLTDVIRAPVAFLSIVVITSVLIQIISWQLLKRTPREYHLHSANRWFGLIPGTVNGIILAAILSALFFAMPLADAVTQGVQESWLAGEFAVVTDKVESTLSPIFAPAIRQTLNRLTTIEPGSDETVQLPFRVMNSTPAPDLEEQMLKLVNEERTSRGLKPLTMDPDLIPVARAHDQDMWERSYFSHYTPEGKDPFERMKDAHITYRAAGENLALAPTLQIAHTGLMNSPGHRANILNPSFGRVGIGIMDGGRRGIMVSQEFRN